MADTDQPLACAECGRKPREDENAEDDWRTYYEGVGDGVTLCPECAKEIGRELASWTDGRKIPPS